MDNGMEYVSGLMYESTRSLSYDFSAFIDDRKPFYGFALPMLIFHGRRKLRCTVNRIHQFYHILSVQELIIFRGIEDFVHKFRGDTT